jgi:Neuraminidase (sialidase)
MSVSRPSTALTWAIGTTRQLKWTHNQGKNGRVKVEVSRDNGATWELIAASVQSASASSGHLQWRVTGPETTRGRIRVSSPDGTVSDISNVPFTITRRAKRINH